MSPQDNTCSTQFLGGTAGTTTRSSSIPPPPRCALPMEGPQQPPPGGRGRGSRRPKILTRARQPGLRGASRDGGGLPGVVPRACSGGRDRAGDLRPTPEPSSPLRRSPSSPPHRRRVSPDNFFFFSFSFK